MADSLVRLRIDSNEFDRNLKEASKNLSAYFDKVKQGGGTFDVLDKGVKECAEAIGNLGTKAVDTKGQINELTKSFTDLSVRYKMMTREEKNSDFGKTLRNSLTQVKTRLDETKRAYEATQRELSGGKFGQFGGVIDNIGKKMGVTGNITEMLTSKTALLKAGMAAAAVAIYKGADAWVKYNKELAQQDQQTTVITGLKGPSANAMTDSVRAISSTYKVDFRQAIEAANTLMVQFGKSGDEAVKLIKDGMRGMIMGDGPKLLHMIQQFAPAFVDAGISADKLVAIIHNSEGGLFSEQNMNAILMGIKNIRLMSNQTSNALAKLGIDGQEMSRKMSDGSMTVFDALRKVATALEGTKSGSKEAGEVMQYVFGRQGAMQGMKLARAIAELNLNLEETKKQTGEVGNAYNDLYEANQKLAVAIRDCFGYDGWEQMATGIKSKLVDALAEVVEKLATIKGYLMGFNANQILKNVYGGGVVPEQIQKDIDALKNASKEQREELYKQQLAGYQKRYQAAAASPGLRDAEALYHADDNGNWLQRYNPLALIGKYYSSTQVNTERAKVESERLALEAYQKAAKQVMNPDTEQTTFDKIYNPSGGGGGNTNKEKIQQELTPLQEVQKQITELSNEALTADNERLEVIRQQIEALQTQAEEYKAIQDYVTKGITRDTFVDFNGNPFTMNEEDTSSTTEPDLTALDRAKQAIAAKLSEQNTLVDETTFSTLLQTAMQHSIDSLDPDFTSLQEKLAEGMNIPDEAWQSLQDKINEHLKELGIEPIKINFETGNLADEGKKTQDSWKEAARAVSSVGNALSQVEAPGAKIAGIIGQAIANIALGFAAATASPATTSTGIFGWIAAIAGGLATMTATIASIHNVTGYAEGGIVKGNSYSGDNLITTVGNDGSLAGLNAGEVVLTKAMQGNLASQLSDNDKTDLGSTMPYVTGEKIVLGINNWGKQTGRGQLVFSRS